LRTSPSSFLAVTAFSAPPRSILDTFQSEGLIHAVLRPRYCHRRQLGINGAVKSAADQAELKRE